MDRFDSYVSEKLGEQIHGAALRDAVRDRLACQATGDRAAEGPETARPQVTDSGAAGPAGRWLESGANRARRRLTAVLRFAP